MSRWRDPEPSEAPGTLITSEVGMRSWQLFFAAVVCLVLTGFTYPQDQGAVTDSADLLSAVAERELDTELTCFRNQTGTFVQVVTVTEDQLGSERLGPYSRGLFAAWQSHFPRDAGRVVILVAASQPGFRISVSRALRGTFDDPTIRRISEDLLPSFQVGNWYTSIFRSVHAIEHEIKPDFQSAAAVTITVTTTATYQSDAGASETTHSSNEDEWSTGEILFAVCIALMLAGLVTLLLIWISNQSSSRRRRSGGVAISADTVEALGDIGEAAGEVGGRAAASAVESFVDNLGSGSGGDWGGSGGIDLGGGSDVGGGDFGGGGGGDW